MQHFTNKRWSEKKITEQWNDNYTWTNRTHQQVCISDPQVGHTHLETHIYCISSQCCPHGPIYKSSLNKSVLRPSVLVLGPQSLRKLPRIATCKQSVMYDHVTPINSVTTIVQVMVKNGLLTEFQYKLQFFCQCYCKTLNFCESSKIAKLNTHKFLYPQTLNCAHD